MYENSHNYHHVNIWGVEPRIRCDHLGDHLGQKIMLIVTVVSVFVSTFISSCIQLKKINSFFFLWSVPWIFSFFLNFFISMLLPEFSLCLLSVASWMTSSPCLSPFLFIFHLPRTVSSKIQIWSCQDTAS